jgi:prolipoprotein diacylglyceryltransferase
VEITHTITVLELVWTIVAVCGLIFNGLLMLRALQDHDWLIHSSVNGDHDLRTYVALTSIFIFSGGFLTQLGYVVVGVIAMNFPSSGVHPHTPQIVTACIFIAGSLIGTTLAAIIYIRRTKVVKIVADRLKLHEPVI